ncbi:MAG: exo-alpha-sialidase [Deltaproteobacteria bacterium]|nr:exo-alpha-sialidase [Deltaproteobacteria bacterium]
MAKAKGLSVREGDVMVMVGTMKGAFLFRADAKRRRWERSGPYLQGNPVYALAYDGRRGRHRLWASANNPFFGTTLRASDDFGAQWTQPKEPNIAFPKKTKLSLLNIWQVVLGNAAEPDTLYCGVEPAALFVSHDAGEKWELVKGLHDHPHRAKWEPGGGGLCLHTIVPHPKDPKRMHIAVSTGGVYRTTNGGKTWAASNKGVRAEFRPDKYPVFGQCVHKIDRHPSKPDRLFLQNHWGLYRSDNGGRSWTDIANGVPSDFGFPMLTHPHRANWAYIMPLESDGFRCMPSAKLRVFRTKNAGKSWEPLARGLPQKDAYETVLRDGLAADALRPAGIYFGTRSGRLYASANDGASWKLVADSLPPITCVKTAVIGREARSA